MVDQDLMDRAQQISGEKTYSATVNCALDELIRRHNSRRILELRGSGLWEADLNAMRRERTLERDE